MTSPRRAPALRPRNSTSCSALRSRSGRRSSSDSASSSTRRSGEQQRRGDLALLGDEDVVGPAGGLHVHHLDADAGARERGGEAGMREALLRPGAEHHDLQSQVSQDVEVFRGEGCERRSLPRAHFAGHDDDARVVARAVDHHVALAVGVDDVGVARDGGVEFHARILAMREFSRIKRLPPYVFNITNELKMAARRRGEDIIDLSMGNPDGPTPQHIVDKLVEAAQRQDTHGYSVSRGIPRLRKAVCDWYRRRYAVELDPDAEAIVTIGSKEGLAHLMLACLERGDTVLVPNPSYPIHIYGAIIAGADIRS